jgi:hypothetical protein
MFLVSIEFVLDLNKDDGVFLCPRIERSWALVFGLSVCLQNIYIGHIFWMVSDRDFICMFLMTRLLYWYQNFYATVSKDRGHIVFGLSVSLSAKNFNIGHIFWMVGDMDFIYVFLMTRPFYWYQKFVSCDLDLEVCPLFKNFNRVISFEW